MVANADPCKCFCHSYYIGFPPGCMCKCRFININPFATQQINGTNVGDYMQKKELSRQEVCYLLGRLDMVVTYIHETVKEIGVSVCNDKSSQEYISYHEDLCIEAKKILEKIVLGYCYT